MQHLQPNTTLQGGKYRIKRVLGQGGFGITYLAEHTLLHRRMAIKEFFLKEDNGREGSSVTMPNTTKQELFDGQKEKFKKEAARLFSIKNDHVIGVHDLFEENGTAYYVMDYVDGESLADRLKRTDKPIPEDEVWLLLPQILDALATVHKEKFCHLDIKPSNIMVDKTGHVKLIDFGASKQMGADGLLTTYNLTAFAQTPGYAPPEQMEQNFDKMGPWTDFYALGATLYTVLTNKKPPRPSDINDDMSADKHLALPGLNLVSAKLRELVLRFLNTNWRQRPRSVEEISSILNNSAAINVKSITEHPDNSNKVLDETTIVEPVKGKQPISNKEASDGQGASSNLIMDDDVKKLADYNVPKLIVSDSTVKAGKQDNEDSNKDRAKEERKDNIYDNTSSGESSQHSSKQQYRGSDLRLKVKLTQEEMNLGVTKKFKVHKDVICTRCHGIGTKDVSAHETCPTCHGSGVITHTTQSIFGMMQTQGICSTCHGKGQIMKGQIVNNKCKQCQGTGVVKGEEEVEIDIPAGVAEGMVVKVPGQGNAGLYGGIPGDIQVLIEKDNGNFVHEREQSGKSNIPSDEKGKKLKIKQNVNSILELIKNNLDLLIPGIALVVLFAFFIWKTNQVENANTISTTESHETILERAERDAREVTEKHCPMPLNEEGTLILERINFYKDTRTWCQDFLLDATPDMIEQINMRDVLLEELKNMPSYKPYMDGMFIFQYVYCDMNNPNDTLINVKLTPKDYE